MKRIVILILLGIACSMVHAQQKEVLPIETLVNRKKPVSLTKITDGKLPILTIAQHKDKATYNAYSHHQIKSNNQLIPFLPKVRGNALKWNATGNEVAFLKRDDNRRAQIFLDKKKKQTQLTYSEGRILLFDWSYNGKYLVYLKENFIDEVSKTNSQLGIKVVDKETKKRIVVKYNIATKTESILYDGELHVSGIACNPVDDSVLLTVSKSSNAGEKLYQSSIAVLQPNGKLNQLSKMSYGTVAWSPNGKLISFFHAAGKVGKTNVPAVIDKNGRNKKILTTKNTGKITTILWKDNQHLLGVEVAGIQNYLCEISIQKDTVTRLLELACEGDTAMIWDKKQQLVYFLDGQYNDEKNVYSFHIQSKAKKQLTELNPQLNEYSFGKLESVQWKSTDNTIIEGLLIYPINYNKAKKYPLVVQLHGGPEWGWSKGFIGSWHDWGQVLANNGYFVLLPNFRGSTGYGIDFIEKNTNDWGGKDTDDVITGVQHLINNLNIDKNKIGVGGWSYGGYLTAKLVGKTSIFKAAIVGAGPMELVSHYYSTDNTQMLDYYFSASPLVNKSLYIERSPVHYMTNMNTPTLIIHGNSDARVDIKQSLMLYEQLKENKITTKMVAYTNEGHGLSQYQHKIDMLNRILDWFNNYLQ